MNVETMKKVAAHVKLSDDMSTAFSALKAEKAASDAKVNELAPKVADLYVKNNYVPEILRDKTAAALTDHVRALELISELVSKPNDAALSIGKPTGRLKEAFVMTSVTEGPAEPPMKEADRKLLDYLGIAY